MMIKELEPTYEAARSWALHPVSHPPAGWAHIVRHGVFAWMRGWQPSAPLPSEAAVLKTSDCSGLLSILAAMIAEVCQ
jgi:hypothetical protein